MPKLRAVAVPCHLHEGGYYSDDAKKTNALDLLKELRGTASLHSSMLKELRQLYKQLRVELKDDIYELVEQVKAEQVSRSTPGLDQPRGTSGYSGRGVTSADDLRAAGVAERFGGRLDSKEETEATSFAHPHVPDERVTFEDVEDVEDESGDGKRTAWEESRPNIRASVASCASFSARARLKRTTTTHSLDHVKEDWAREFGQGERTPAVPLGKSRYPSSVDLIKASLDVDEDAGWVERMVTQDYFDYVMGFILALNAIIVGVQVDLVSREARDPAWSRVIDLTFCSIFVIELLLRTKAYGKKFFSMDGWQWNVFDLFVVVFSVADEATKLVLSDSEVQEVFESFGMLRLLRLGRIVRLVRMVRLIPALKSMVYLILASLKSFLWTVVLLIILMYCVAVYFTELAYDLRNKHPQKDFSSLGSTWGSIGNSILSLFQAITGGNDWHNFISVFDDYVGSSTSTNTLVFSIFIAFATLVMMNLVTGVFVDGAQRIAREEKNQDLLKHVRRLLAPERIKTPRASIFIHGEFSFDDGDRLITWQEFCKKLESEEMKAYLTAFELDDSQAKDIFYILDQERVGKVTMREFFSACVNLHATPRLADTAILRHLIQRTFADLLERINKLDVRLGGTEAWVEPQQPSFVKDTRRRGEDGLPISTFHDNVLPDPEDD